MILQTKIDDSFLIGNFGIDGYSTPYRLDGNFNSGGILLYIREDIPSYLIATKKEPVESFYVKLNLHNGKYLINYSSNPQKIMIHDHLATLETFFDLQSFKIWKAIEARRFQHIPLCGPFVKLII